MSKHQELSTSHRSRSRYLREDIRSTRFRVALRSWSHPSRRGAFADACQGACNRHHRRNNNDHLRWYGAGQYAIHARHIRPPWISERPFSSRQTPSATKISGFELPARGGRTDVLRLLGEIIAWSTYYRRACGLRSLLSLICPHRRHLIIRPTHPRSLHWQIARDSSGNKSAITMLQFSEQEQ